MPLPPGVTTRTYTGTIVGLDGANATGTLEFRQPKPIYDATNNVVVGPQKPITATVAAGAFTAQLPVSPWQYVVRIATDAIKDVYLLLVEADTEPLHFADTYLTAAPAELVDFYVLRATFDALAARVADLEETGGVSVPDATSTTKGILRLAGDLAGTATAPTVPGLVAKYTKPGSGIPATDLTAAVQALLTLAGTAVQPGGLATVATSGAYADLSGKPSIPDSYDDLTGTVPTSALPALAVIEYLGPVANQAAMLALTGQKGDWCTRTDLGTTWIITGDTPSQLASWTALSYPAAPVSSVNGQAGAVTLAKGDIGLGNVANLAPADLGISTATQTALDDKVDETLVNAAGDLLVGSGDNVLVRLPKGVDGQLLGVASGTVGWVDPPDTGGAAGALKAFATTGMVTGTFGPCGDSGTWTLCPAEYRVTLPASVGDRLLWTPGFLHQSDQEAMYDIASVVAGTAARYRSSGTNTPAAAGYGGLYTAATLGRGMRPVWWTVTADDLDGGTVTLALAYRNSGSGNVMGHASVAGDIVLANAGQPA